MRAATFEAHRLAGDPSGSFSAGLTNIPDNTVLLCRGAKLLQALHPFAAVPRGYSTTEEPRPISQHRILQICALIHVKHAMIALGMCRGLEDAPQWPTKSETIIQMMTANTSDTI